MTIKLFKAPIPLFKYTKTISVPNMSLKIEMQLDQS